MKLIALQHEIRPSGCRGREALRNKEKYLHRVSYISLAISIVSQPHATPASRYQIRDFSITRDINQPFPSSLWHPTQAANSQTTHKVQKDPKPGLNR